MSEYVLLIDKKEYRAEVSELTADHAVVAVNGQSYRVELRELARGKFTPVETRRAETAAPAPTPRPAAPSGKAPLPGSGVIEGSSIIRAPLPGLITAVNFREGDTVKAGQSVIVMEAMKMENQIQAGCDGTVKKVFVKKGDNVNEGMTLAEIARPGIATI